MNITKTFNSWTEFVDRAESGKPTARTRSSRKNGEHWSGASFNEAVRMARQGWPEGTKLVHELSATLYNNLPAKRLKLQPAYSVVGPGTLDMGRYIQGHPESMMVWVESETEDVVASGGKIVSVVYNIAASSGVSAKEMLDKGVVACALVDLLERAGRRVELVMAVGVRSWRSAYTMRVPLKLPQDPLDMDRLAYAVAHASCLRRLCFSVWECEPAEVVAEFDFNGGSYSTPATVSVEEHELLIPHTLWFPGFKFADYMKWLVKQLATQGVEIDD